MYIVFECVIDIEIDVTRSLCDLFRSAILQILHMFMFYLTELSDVKDQVYGYDACCSILIAIFTIAVQKTLE
jgi:hypothetical protein